MVNYLKDWEELALDEIYFFRRGSFPQPYGLDKWYGGLNSKPFIQVVDVLNNFKISNPTKNNISEQAKPYSVKAFPGQMVITIQGSIGRVAIIEKESYLDRTLLLFEKEKITINKEYAKFAIYKLFQEKKEMAPGAVIKTITKNVLKDFKIFLPPLEEQQAIAETLMAFDEHIENLEELIAKKKMIRDGAVEDLMSGKTRLNGSDGEWETVQFQNVITPKARIGWQGLKKDEYLKKGFVYLISGTDFENGSISLNKISYVKKERYSMDANIQVKEGDVLVTKDGTIGKIARVPELNKKATLNSGVFVFRTNHLLEECFLYWILRSSIFGKFIDDLSAGSTIKHLYQKDLKNFSFTMPVEIKEQKAIASILTAMDEEIEDLRQEKDKIEKIKAGAMDDLLTGKIRLVKEA